MIPRTTVLEPVRALEDERPAELCRVHFTAIENCLDEHGLDLLEPVLFYRLGSERTRWTP